MKRREFLTLMGATLFGPEAKPSASPLQETNPTKQSDTKDVSDMPLYTLEEAPLRENVEIFTPRTSTALEARIAERMEALRTHFGAEVYFERALDMEYEEDPLMDVVYDTFQEHLQELPAFRNMDYRSINWMVELCCYGEVTAESGWDVNAVGAGTDRGLWQITDEASSQIAIERDLMEVSPRIVDRYNPIDATKGAAEYFNFTLRALHSWIDKEPGEESLNTNDSDELNIFDLANETEFIIPLIVTGYKCGPEPLKTALSAFYRSNPDTSPVGLDVFMSFIDYLHEHPVEGISETDLDYFIKCLALKRIFDEFQAEEIE